MKQIKKAKGKSGLKKINATKEKINLKPDDIPSDAKKAIIERLNATFSIGAVNPYALVNAWLIHHNKDPINWQQNIIDDPEKGFEMNRCLLCRHLKVDKFEHIFDAKYAGPVYWNLIKDMKMRKVAPEKFFRRKDVLDHVQHLIRPHLQPENIHQPQVWEPDKFTNVVENAIQNGKFDQSIIYRGNRR